MCQLKKYQTTKVKTVVDCKMNNSFDLKMLLNEDQQSGKSFTVNIVKLGIVGYGRFLWSV